MRNLSGECHGNANSYSEAPTIIAEVTSSEINAWTIDDAQRRAIGRYTEFFEQAIRRAAADAFERLGPARLAWGTGRCDFAVNRRSNKPAA